MHLLIDKWPDGQVKRCRLKTHSYVMSTWARVDYDNDPSLNHNSLLSNYSACTQINSQYFSNLFLMQNILKHYLCTSQHQLPIVEWLKKNWNLWDTILHLITKVNNILYHVNFVLCVCELKLHCVLVFMLDR